MLIDYDKEKLKRALTDFSNATGLNINFVDSSFSHSAFHKISHNCYCRAILSTEQGKKRCLKSDKELLIKCEQSKKHELHICHAGLVDIAVPIFHGNSLLGYIIFGQMKTEPDFSVVENYVASLPLDLNKMREYYTCLPLFRDETISSIASIAVMLTKYVLLENMLKPRFDQKVTDVISFIDINLDKHLSVQHISEHVNISKTALYNIFHTHFDCTVNEYINARRIEKSTELLLKTDLSVEEISQRLGFSSAAYYSKLFKKQKGIPPIKFRKLKHW